MSTQTPSEIPERPLHIDDETKPMPDLPDSDARDESLAEFPSDTYSDVASNNSDPGVTPRRKYQRGGRKSNKGPAEGSSDTLGIDPETECTCTCRCRENRTPIREFSSRTARPTSRKSVPRSRTGISGFNVKKGPSSNGRPFGITLEKPQGNTKASKKHGAAAHENSHLEAGGGEVEEEEEEKVDEPEARKPMSIRLDLNLELEIFLRAKIKGDITITFL
ncbi:hypothetical protein B7494_g7836 [Chlorociboria aeruginascens]|nr:hypothetical protein B7494_g7836 [Chlorociboria aeruginascens]